MRKIARHVNEADWKTPAYARSRRQRKKVEVLLAHLKRILRLRRLRLRGPSGAHDEFLVAATAQNPRRWRCGWHRKGRNWGIRSQHDAQGRMRPASLST
jgi:hypothetical protein